MIVAASAAEPAKTTRIPIAHPLHFIDPAWCLPYISCRSLVRRMHREG
jgi:hypothetical protein